MDMDRGRSSSVPKRQQLCLERGSLGSQSGENPAFAEECFSLSNAQAQALPKFGKPLDLA